MGLVDRPSCLLARPTPTPVEVRTYTLEKVRDPRFSPSPVSGSQTVVSGYVCVFGRYPTVETRNDSVPVVRLEYHPPTVQGPV